MNKLVDYTVELKPFKIGLRFEKKMTIGYKVKSYKSEKRSLLTLSFSKPLLTSSLKVDSRRKIEFSLLDK